MGVEEGALGRAARESALNEPEVEVESLQEVVQGRQKWCTTARCCGVAEPASHRSPAWHHRPAKSATFAGGGGSRLQSARPPISFLDDLAGCFLCRIGVRTTMTAGG